TLRLDGSWESQEPTRVGTLTLPTTGGTRTTLAGGGLASLTSYFGGRFINELRGYVAQQRRDARAFLALPAAVVDVASDLPNGGHGVAALAFGGSFGLPQHIHNRSLEIADEFSWLPGRTAHRLKLGIDVIGTHVDEGQTANQLGTFTYPSLAALAADSPATFTRTLAPRAQAGTAWNGAAYFGDSWRTGGGLQLIYGARLEVTRFDGAPRSHRAVESLFAVPTAPGRGAGRSPPHRDRLRSRLRRAPRPARVARAAASLRQQ